MIDLHPATTRRSALLLLLISILAGAGLGQSILDDPGPYAVTLVDTDDAPTLLGTTPSPIAGRLYLPDGPGSVWARSFPLVGFMHAYVGSNAIFAPDFYDALCTHIASWGFVVASIATQGGMDATPEAEALDCIDLMNWVELNAPSPGPLCDIVWPGARRAAIGHSLGATGAMFMPAHDPRSDVLIALQPYTGPTIDFSFFPLGLPQNVVDGWIGADQALANFDGTLFIVESGEDEAVLPGAADYFFDAATDAKRRIRLGLDTAGHVGALDGDEIAGVPLGASMSHVDQSRLMRRICAGVLLAEFSCRRRAENAYYHILGAGLQSPTPVPSSIRVDCLTKPIFWFRPTGNPEEAEVGVAALGGATLDLYSRRYARWCWYGVEQILDDEPIPASGVYSATLSDMSWKRWVKARAFVEDDGLRYRSRLAWAWFGY